jgi:hypothetical protein
MTRNARFLCDHQTERERERCSSDSQRRPPFRECAGHWDPQRQLVPFPPHRLLECRHSPSFRDYSTLPSRSHVPALVAASLLVTSFVVFLFARDGLAGFSDEAARRSWIATHTTQWRLVWLSVGAAMVGLGFFFLWWSARLNRRGGRMPALLVVFTAVTVDLAGLGILAFGSAGDAASLSSLGNVLAVGIATPLYSICFLWFLGLGPPQSRFVVLLARVQACSSILAVVSLVAGSEVGLAVGLGGYSTPRLRWSCWWARDSATTQGTFSPMSSVAEGRVADRRHTAA